MWNAEPVQSTLRYSLELLTEIQVFLWAAERSVDTIHCLTRPSLMLGQHQRLQNSFFTVFLKSLFGKVHSIGLNLVWAMPQIMLEYFCLQRTLLQIQLNKLLVPSPLSTSSRKLCVQCKVGYFILSNHGSNMAVLQCSVETLRQSKWL